MGRRIAVYGGSFNPFCDHHADIVRWLVTEGDFNVVIVVPSAAHALKDDLPEYLHRYNMAKLGVNHLRYNGVPSLPFESTVMVSQIEMHMLTKQPAPIRTYELLQELAQGYSKEDEIKFAIGPDIPDELHKWARVEDIERDFGFAHLPVQSMRATKLRQMIHDGVDAWKHHVPLPVRRYIEMHGLYRESEAA